METKQFNPEELSNDELRIYSSIEMHKKAIVKLTEDLEKAIAERKEKESLQEIISKWNDKDSLQERIKELSAIPTQVAEESENEEK